MYLICHLIEGSCSFMGGTFLQYYHQHCDTEDMFLICHVTCHEDMFKGFLAFVGGRLSG